MDDADRPERVEVELTATSETEPTRRRGRSAKEASRASAASTSRDAVEPLAASVREPDREADRDRSRRTTAIAVAAGVVGLVGGWLIGASGGGGDPADTDAAAPSAPADAEPTTPATGTSTERALEPIDPVPTTTASTSDATMLTVLRGVGARPTFPVPDASLVTLSLPGVLAGTDARLVGVVSSSTIADVDVDAAPGEMITRRHAGFFDSFSLVAGDDWIAVSDPASGRAKVITIDGSVRQPDLGDAWLLLPIPGTDDFWRVEPSDAAPPVATRYTRVDLNGVPTGPTIDGPSTWARGVDPNGGVLTVDQGKTFALEEDGVRFVGDGEVVGISADVAVLRRCDEALVCGLERVDRSTGEVTAVPSETPVGAEMVFGWPQLRAMLSPDGSRLSLVRDGFPLATLVIIDVGSGEEIVVDTVSPETPWSSWAPDGRSLAFVKNGRPMIYDVAAAESFPLADDLQGWQRIEFRPAPSS